MDEDDSLLAAYHARNSEALRNAVTHVKKKESAPLLAKLLLEQWHDSHEDIVFKLGLIGDPRTVEAIARAAVISFNHLIEWDNLHEFQRKCAYALARIGTSESRNALETLAQHSDPHLREYGQEGLQKWPLPYKGDDYV